MVLVAPAMLVKLAPPLVDRCHCTVGAGNPDAAAMKLTDAPEFTDWFAGLVVTAGAWFTVTVSVWVPLGFTPFDAVRLSEYTPPVPAAGVPARVAVPLPLSVKLSPVGTVPVLLMAGVGDAVAVVVIVNEPAVPTVKEVLFALVNAAAWLTDTLSVWVALGFTPLFAVRLNGYDPPAVGVPAKVAVPLPLSVKVIPGGTVPVLLIAGAG